MSDEKYPFRDKSHEDETYAQLKYLIARLEKESKQAQTTAQSRKIG